MSYVKRAMERKFLSMSGFFKAVLLTGARQTGKTTMLRHLSEGSGRAYVSLDDAFARELAQDDPGLFFQRYRPPLLIDEVQKAPRLFEHIKAICDGSGGTGLFWLTGSQGYGLMKGIRESLAGRVGILELQGFSQRETGGRILEEDIDFSFRALAGLRSDVPEAGCTEIFHRIWRGGMPQAQEADEEQLGEFFNSYTETYLMRDIFEAGGVRDTGRFRRFLGACAALAGEQVNCRTLAECAGISAPTAKEWLSLLEAMGVVYLLKPFSGNALKRLAKTPKLYFYDTGLCAWLSRWLTRDALMSGAAAGHYFENYVISELVKNFSCARTPAGLFYYRDSNAREIDLLVARGNRLHPFEIKLSASPDRRAVKKFGVIDGLSWERGSGGIICMCRDVVPVTERDCYIPCDII